METFGASPIMLPDCSDAKQLTEREFFKVDYTLFLNLACELLSAAFLFWKWRAAVFFFGGNGRIGEKVLFVLVISIFLWLAVRLLIPIFL